MNLSLVILLSVLLATAIVVTTNIPTILAAKHHKNASTDNDNDESSSHKNKTTSNNPDPDHDGDNDHKTLNSYTSNSTVTPSSGTTSTTTPTKPIENNKGEPIKGAPVGICLVGVKSACNGPAFEHP
ncbi:MAG TPA: hypothetical protein VH500_21465 [Nitrososphaeraceae archaeon]|jgi:cytoskeletal protein RodZ